MKKLCYGIIATIMISHVLFLLGYKINQPVATKMTDSLSLKIVKLGNLKANQHQREAD